MFDIDIAATTAIRHIEQLISIDVGNHMLDMRLDFIKSRMDLKLAADGRGDGYTCMVAKWRDAETRASKYRQLYDLTNQALVQYHNTKK